MSKSKLLTLNDLIEFCKKNNFSHFSAKEEKSGPIIVHEPGTFSMGESAKNGLLPVKLQACHTGLNRNESSISSETMNAALPSFSNRPILGYIHQLEDGTWDFYSHNVAFVEDDNEEDGVRLDYLETPVGIIPESCEASLKYDELKEKTYVEVNGYIFEEYSKAADILRAKGISKVSVELAINEMSYNAKEGYLSIDDFYFCAVTILGRDEDGNVVEEGMEGSNITLGSFSQDKNSILSDGVQAKMIETLNKLNEALEKFNDTNEKGGDDPMDKFNELLEQYGVTEDDIDFDCEGLSDEELEAAFEEHFGCKPKKKKKKCSNDGEDDFSSKFNKTVHENGDISLTYAISHEDVKCALYNLIETDSNYVWISEVFDDYCVYQSWNDGKYYKQGYAKDGDNVSLSGDVVEVYAEFVTADEKAALAALRLEYAELKQFKDEYEASCAQAEKDQVFEDEKYSILVGNEKFEQLKKDAKNFSVDEIKSQCKIIFADHVIESGEYSAEKSGQNQKTGKIDFNFSQKSKKAEAYAGLFDE